MQKLLLTLFCCLSGSLLVSAQDFLSVPSSNPHQFRLDKSGRVNDKLDRIENNFIYQYDTLELPFLDDFSTDHFPERITDLTDSRLTDSLYYALFVNGVKYLDSLGFTQDTTYRYFIGTAGDTISVTPNGTITISYSDLMGPVTYKTYTVFPAYTLFDTLSISSIDTVILDNDFPQDSLVFYTVAPNKNDYYTDRHVYRNNTFPLNPPSIGVVTFDGLDEFGLAYNIDFDLKVPADTLTSVPINLSNLPDSNVFFSFYFQPKGLSIDKPEKEDSLSLDFFNASTGEWGNIWRTIGFAADTFQQVIIEVPRNFQLNGFQFRFRNYASSAGAFDQWHIDYLYLNNGRSETDLIYKDIAYVYDAPSLLKDYHAMPYFHYVNDPSIYMKDTLLTTVVNSSSDNLPIYNKVVIPDTTTGSDFFQYPVDLNEFVILPPSDTVEFIYPLSNFAFPMNKVDSLGRFQSFFDIDFRPTMSQEEDFIRSNDTVISNTVLRNYYAYDDGTAEAGYGVNPTLSASGRIAYMAVEFNIPLMSDTLEGLQMYFLPQTADVTKQNFVITVWSSLSPPNVIYEKTVLNSPVYSDDNMFLNYGFDSAVVVNQTFYVGMKAIGVNSMNVGYDLNSNSRENIHWSLDGTNWSNPSNGIFDGSLMIRPFFRERLIGVGLGESIEEKDELILYPNPVGNELNVKFEKSHLVKEIEILDLTGRLLRTQKFESRIDVSSLNNGIYLLRLLGIQEEQLIKKFIVSH